MTELENFVKLLSGTFDNSRQLRELESEGVTDFPAARHLNTVCNQKIEGLPEGFAGVFLVEESYYTVNGYTRASSHLFLFTQEGDSVKLTSYELPAGCDKNSFTYETMSKVRYEDLKVSEKFTPAYYTKRGDVWEGGSVSMFSPVLKFTLAERLSREVLEVSETMEMNGRRTFGYDRPILYRRTSQQ